MFITVTAYYEEAMKIFGFYPSLVFERILFGTYEEFYDHCLKSLRVIVPDLNECDMKIQEVDLVDDIKIMNCDWKMLRENWDALYFLITERKKPRNLLL